MLRIQRIGKRLKSFAHLKTKPLEEFYELGDFIANSPEEFFGEIGEPLFLAANGLRTAEDADSYVDVLGFDRQGAAVVVLITPADAESPLTRAMNSASRIAGWDADELARRIGLARSKELRTYVAENYRNLNKRQRVILLAESFSQDLLGTAAWLSGSYGVDLVCVEVTLAYDSTTGDEFLNAKVMMGRPDQQPVVAVSSPPPLKPEPDPKPDPKPNPKPEPKPEPEPEPAPIEEPLFEDLGEGNVFADLAPEPGDMPVVLFDEPEQPNFEPEQRLLPRRNKFQSNGMTVQYAGRDMSAGLVDYSNEGVGLTMHSPLPVGMSIVVKGNLSWGDTEVEIEKRGRVTHCNFLGQAFRLGVLFTSAEAARAGS